MDYPELCEKELAARCAESDIKAKEMLYTRYAARVNALCYRYVSNEDDARDLMHDVMIHVFRNIHRFRWSGEGSLGGWIMRIAVNMSIDRLRKGKRLKLSHTDSVTLDRLAPVEDELQTADGLAAVPAAVLLGMVASLPDVQRTVFNLYCLDGFSHKEIARMLGIAENSSSSALSRAKSCLKELIKNYLDSNL